MDKDKLPPGLSYAEDSDLPPGLSYAPGPTVEAAAGMPDRDLTPDEFGEFAKTGKLPEDVSRVAALRNMSKAKRAKALRKMPVSLVGRENLAERYGVDHSTLSRDELDQAFEYFQKNIVNAGQAAKTPIGAMWEGAKRMPEELYRGGSQLGAYATEKALGALSGEKLSLGLGYNNLMARLEDEAHKKKTGSYPLSATAGEVLAGLPIPLGKGNAILGSASKLKSLARVAGEGALASTLMPVTDEDFIGTKAKQALGGAIVAPIAQYGLETGMAGITKLAAAHKRIKLPQEYRAADAEIRKFGFTPDAASLMDTTEGFVPSITSVAKMSPIGNLRKTTLANKRVATHKISDLQSQYRAGASREEFEWLPLVRELAEGNGPQKKQANFLLSRVEEAARNPDARPQVDIEGRTFFNEFKPGGSSELYGLAADLSPSERINTSSIVDAIDAEKRRLSGLGADAEEGIIGYLNRLQDDFRVDDIDHLGGFGRQQKSYIVSGEFTPDYMVGSRVKKEPIDHLLRSEPPIKPGPEPASLIVTTGGSPRSGMDYRRLLEKSRLISERRDRIFRGSDELKSRSSSAALTNISRAYDEALAAAEQGLGTQAFREASAAARQAHRTGVAPGKTQEMLSMLQLQPDDFVKKFAAMTPDSKTETLRAMGEAGRKTLLAKEFDDIARASLDPTAQVSGESFNRNAFLSKINERMEHLKAIGSPSEVAELEGFQRVVKRLHLMDDTNHIQPGKGRWKYNLVPAVLFRNMLLSPSGQKALLTISRSRAGSPIEQFFIHSIERKIPKLLSMAPPDLLEATGITPGGGKNPVEVDPFVADVQEEPNR